MAIALSTATLAGGGLQMAGGIGGAIASARQAAKNRAFQERMYKNRYQYQVKDLRDAGLNPMLAYMQSPGAAPAGSAAQIKNPADGVVASATQARLARGQKELLKEQAIRERYEGHRAFAQQGMAENQSFKLRAETELLRAQLPSARAIAEFDDSKIGRDLTKARRAAGKAFGWLPTMKD